MTKNMTNHKKISKNGNENCRFVAINFIRCKSHYRKRFEELFTGRAHAIDKMPGFLFMEVLRPSKEGEYLIVSHWKDEKYFRQWTKSPEFLEGHKRGFADIQEAKERGEEPPMISEFRTYSVIAN